MTDNAKPQAPEHSSSSTSADSDGFWSILQRRLSRRGMLQSSTVMGAAAVLPFQTCEPSAVRLKFSAVPKGLQDHVVVPEGYTARVLTALGDPIDEATPANANDGTAQDFARRVGDHGDALAFFALPKGSRDSKDGLLVQNHEAATDVYLHANGGTNDPYSDKAATAPRPLSEVLVEQEVHGISLLRITKSHRSGKWSVDRRYRGNSRWHVNTEMVLSGPAAGSKQVVTKLSPRGDRCFGTLNNCGHGMTPWGTYLSGEENWAFYFTRGDDAAADPVRNARLSRQGLVAKNVDPARKVAPFNYRGWDRAEGGGDLQKRFDCTISGATAADDFRNEPNHFGYVVELDPYAPEQPVKKRTALGRMAHEGAWFGPVVVGKPLVVYMGDDSRNEYVYKFVSHARWRAADARGGLAAGDKYLDRGTLYAARFDESGSGEWLPLSLDNPALASFEDLADIVINTRSAADAASATPMDRPEWGAVNPNNGEFYLTLTNNSTRGTTGPAVDAANPRTYTDPKGSATQRGNVNGHILRLRETSNDAAATTFTWDVYLFGAQADADEATVNLSGLTAENDFSSPDGLWFDARGLLWIQTDDGAYTDVTNCMMLAGVPGAVGDGEEIMVGSQVTQLGQKPGAERLRRFLVGVPGSEITGVDLTPDHKTMFVNIQHPGESGNLATFQSNWPSMTSDDASATGTPGTRPRTATIVITRDDGGTIGV
jgi:uncharacterized protein